MTKRRTADELVRWLRDFDRDPAKANRSDHLGHVRLRTHVELELWPVESRRMRSRLAGSG